MRIRLLLTTMVFLVFSTEAVELILDYTTPAGQWNEALPLGNGRIGAMVFGGPGIEQIQLNEDTLWAGGPNYALEPRMREIIPERRRILGGDPIGAHKYFQDRHVRTSKNGNSFAYQTLGSLLLKFDGHDFPVDYRRSLSLEDAIARSSYRIDDVVYRREAFVALADDVMVVRLTASKPGAISFTAFWQSPHQRDAKAVNDGVGLTLSGRASRQFDVDGAVRYFVRLLPQLKGGRLAC